QRAKELTPAGAFTSRSQLLSFFGNQHFGLSTLFILIFNHHVFILDDWFISLKDSLRFRVSQVFSQNIREDAVAEVMVIPDHSVVILIFHLSVSHRLDPRLFHYSK